MENLELQKNLCRELIENKTAELDDAFQGELDDAFQADDGSAAWQQYIDGIIRELDDAIRALHAYGD